MFLGRLALHMFVHCNKWGRTLNLILTDMEMKAAHGWPKVVFTLPSSVGLPLTLKAICFSRFAFKDFESMFAGKFKDFET